MGLMWFRGRKYKAPAQNIYLAVSIAARHQLLFTELAVPDTLDGRFDAVVLHLALVIRRLDSLGDEGHMVARQTVGVFVDDMDRTVREMGVGDLSVGKHVKRMVQALYGRLAAYDTALQSLPDESPLMEALGRNLYAGQDQAAGILKRMVGYVEMLDRLIEGKALEEFLGLQFETIFVGLAEQAAAQASP